MSTAAFAPILAALGNHVARVRERTIALDGGVPPPRRRRATMDTRFVFDEVYTNIERVCAWLREGGIGHLDLGAVEGRLVRLVHNTARGRRGHLVPPSAFNGMVHVSFQRAERNRRLGRPIGRTHYNDLPRDRHCVRRYARGVVYGECCAENGEDWVSFYFCVPALEQRRAEYAKI
jgi:hypothetical protein